MNFYSSNLSFRARIPDALRLESFFFILSLFAQNGDAAVLPLRPRSGIFIIAENPVFYKTCHFPSRR